MDFFVKNLIQLGLQEMQIPIENDKLKNIQEEMQKTDVQLQKIKLQDPDD